MNTKLVLDLDKNIIEQAEIYAHKNQQDLSALVENYLRYLLQKDEQVISADISVTVKELSGIINPGEIENIREDYTDYLLEKYQ